MQDRFAPTATAALIATFILLTLFGFRRSHADERRVEVEVLPARWAGKGGAAIADADGMVWLWGGTQPREAAASDVDRFSPQDGTIQRVRCAGDAAPGTFVPAMASDSTLRRAYVFGGWPVGAEAPSDQTHVLNLRETPPRWNHVSVGDARPPARNGAVFAPDVRDDQLILFGGDAGPGMSFNPLGDTWRFRPATARWVQVPAKGDVPSPRWHAMGVVDSAGRKFYLIGGAGRGAFDRDLYALDLASDTWRRIRRGDSPAPPSLQGATLTLDARRSVLVLCGGLRHEEPGPGTSDEIWVFDCATERWQRLEHRAPAMRRRDHVAVYDAKTDAHYLLGGHVSDQVGNFYRTGAPVESIVRLRVGPAGAKP